MRGGALFGVDLAAMLVSVRPRKLHVELVSHDGEGELRGKLVNLRHVACRGDMPRLYYALLTRAYCSPIAAERASHEHRARMVGFTQIHRHKTCISGKWVQKLEVALEAQHAHVACHVHVEGEQAGER